MPIKPEAVIGYLGVDLEKFENEDAFKAHFDSTFIRKEIAHDDGEVQNRVFGKTNNVLRGKLKNTVKAIGIEDIEVDWDKANPAEIIDVLKDKVSGSVTALRTELEAAKKSTSGKSTKDIEELQQKLDAAIRERDAFGAQAKDFESKYSTLEGSIKQREAQAKIDGVFERAMDAVKFRDDVNAYARKGFEADMRSKYKLEFGEDGKAKVIGPDGNPIMNPSKAQTYMTMEEIMSRHAEEAKLTGGNPQGGTPVKRVVTTMATSVSAAAPEHRKFGARIMPAG